MTSTLFDRYWTLKNLLLFCFLYVFFYPVGIQADSVSDLKTQSCFLLDTHSVRFEEVPKKSTHFLDLPEIAKNLHLAMVSQKSVSNVLRTKYRTNVDLARLVNRSVDNLETADRYWNYYRHCERWGVRFGKVIGSSEAFRLRNNRSLAKSIGWCLKKSLRLASVQINQLVATFRRAEFLVTENLTRYSVAVEGFVNAESKRKRKLTMKFNGPAADRKRDIKMGDLILINWSQHPVVRSIRIQMRKIDHMLKSLELIYWVKRIGYPESETD